MIALSFASIISVVSSSFASAIDAHTCAACSIFFALVTSFDARSASASASLNTASAFSFAIQAASYPADATLYSSIFFAEKFTNGPYSIQNSGDQIKVTLNVSLDWLYIGYTQSIFLTLWGLHFATPFLLAVLGCDALQL